MRSRSAATPGVVARVGAHAQVLLDGELREDAAPLGHERQAAARDLEATAPADVLAVVHARGRPAGRTRPVIALSVVVLPAPLAPIRHTSSPSPTARSMPFTARMPP